MPAQQLLLNWKDHNGTLVSVFENLLKKNTLVDCTLAAEGQYLKAHKVVLSACSSYFELLFSQENEKNPIVILKDVKFQELEAAVNFMYRGEVEVWEDRLSAFLEVADSLQIKGLGSEGKLQNPKEKVSSIKCSNGKSATTQRQQIRKEDSNPHSDNVGPSKIVSADAEHTRNDDSCSFHHSSRSGSSPVVTVSTFSVKSSSCSVSKETCRDLDSLENIPQTLVLPVFTSGENVQSENNPTIKTEPETDTFIEDKSDVADKDLRDDASLMDDQNDSVDPNTEDMEVVPTNQQDIGAGWIHSGDQQNFLSELGKDEPDTSASWNQEAIAHSIPASIDTAGPSSRTSETYAGMDNLVNEDREQSIPATVQFYTHVSGVAPSNVSGKLTDASLQRTMPRVSSKKLCCPICKQLFVQLMDLEKHMHSKNCGSVPNVSEGKHRPVNPSITQPGRLLRSDPRSSKLTLFKCSECNYVTPKGNNLRRHFRIHTGDKPFKCPHCDYASGFKEALVRHIRIHTGDTPFKCPYCDYASKDGLAKHLRTHTGEKPFKCPHCDHACRTHSNLRTHIRTHMAPFKCISCDAQFKTLKSLQRHQRCAHFS